MLYRQACVQPRPLIIIIIIIIVRRFLTRRNSHVYDITRARVNHPVDECHTVSAAVQSGAVKQVQSLQCDFKSVDQLKSTDVMSMPWMVKRALVESTLFRSDRALKDANLSCGSGRPTWRCRAAGSGLVETTLAVEIVERSADRTERSSTVCLRLPSLGCKHGTAGVCCWAPCCGPVLPHPGCWRPGCVKAAPPLLQRDRRTDGRPTVA